MKILKKKLSDEAHGAIIISDSIYMLVKSHPIDLVEYTVHYQNPLLMRGHTSVV